MQEKNKDSEAIIKIRNFSGYYDKKQSLKNVSVDIYPKKITAIIGPSGCGKSTLLRSINRMNDEISSYHTQGELLLDKKNVYDKGLDLTIFRKKVGMVFQKPTPFPMSVFDNVAFGPRIHGIKNKAKLEQIVENSLSQASLWNEVKNELFKSAFSLSGGQQQRLCIARALAVDPEVILLDEPTSALDPIATQNIEVLLEELSEKYTIIIVTHNLSQAVRISDYMLFMYEGDLVEYGETSELIRKPKNKRTEEYFSGKFS
jgi:phosphate transport system ATP-binding protein